MPAGGRVGRRRSPRPWLRPPSDGDGNRAIRGRAIAELAVDVRAPAVGSPGAREAAGVIATSGKGAEAQAAGDAHRGRAARGRAGAELTVDVLAPAVGCPGAR